MAIFWVCSVVAMMSAAVAAFSAGGRTVAFALWCAGLAVGGIFLTLGAEALAVVQAVISTLVALSFLFHSTLFGEGCAEDGLRARGSTGIKIVLFSCLGAAVSGAIFFAASGLAQSSAAPGTGRIFADIHELGTVLVSRHMMSVVIVGLALFLVLIGAGVVARPESENDEPSEEAG